MQRDVCRSEWKAQVRSLCKMLQEVTVTGPQSTPDTHEALHITQHDNNEYGKKGGTDNTDENTTDNTPEGEVEVARQRD